MAPRAPAENRRSLHQTATDPAPDCRDLAADGAMGVPKACAFVGLGKTEMYRLMDMGEIAFARHGTKRLVFRRSLVEFLAARMSGD
jgi:excisionase family DNA binding protein